MLTGDVMNHVAPSKRQAHNRVLPRYGDDFWGDNTNRSPHRLAPFTDPPPPPRRNSFNFLRFNVRPIYEMAPLTEAEIAAAMQDVTGNEANGSAQPGGTAVGVQGPQQAPPTQTPQVQTFGAGTDESVIGCCGFYLVRHRS
ncbi:hypothetical protein AZE42_09044 [Rhizopogon vesiculosus]|uniref:Uncharacterized protein n=1 Tax=Rhizopogon vesiculosus TaxID=180088 RepID=A0A1J8PUE7_9AGAM|nr:hypothetical protein AZE42_09044 [Rhizopogon vesiculosus]